MSIFSKTYWKRALLPFSDTRSLCLAAAFIALRVAVDAISIPLGPDLYISVSFLVTALGSAIYGPVMGLACGAVTDTIGALLFPKGAYFFPFIFVEMLGALLFGLFLWNRNITPTKLILAKFSVTVLCNLILNSLLLIWMFDWLGNGQTAVFFSIPRIVKNVTLFPGECFLLILLFSILLPPLSKLTTSTKIRHSLQFKPIHAVLLGGLLILSIGVGIAYSLLYLPTL